jgi:type IV pilus assembly protein PilN
MIKINLLPYREQAKKESLVQQIVLIAGLFIIFILILAGVAIYFSSQVTDLETNLAGAKQNLKDLDARVGNLEQYKVKNAEMELKLGVINTLEENRSVPVKMLDDLAMLVPQKSIWLTKIEQKNDSLTIEGIGRDNIAAADFMKTVESFPPLQSVDLVTSKKTEIAGETLQQFVFSCKMKKGF